MASANLFSIARPSSDESWVLGECNGQTNSGSIQLVPKSPEPSKNNWSANKEATKRVSQLLQDSGALLETEMSEVCQQFVNVSHKKQGVRVSTDSITYGKDTEESPLRQIDQSLSLYKEFILDELTGVQLQVHLPIEAKYRKDLEGFGIEYPANSYRPRVPLVGFLRGSQLSERVHSLMPLANLMLSHVVFLEIRGASQPQKIHSENLVYNASAALYDFIKFDLGGEEEQGESYEGKVIQDMRLVDRFEQYLKEKHHAWFSVIRSWMLENLTDTLVEEYNRRLGKGRVYYSMTGHIPIVCLNGPLWSFRAGKFQPHEALLTRVRVPNWPGRLRRELIRYTAEAPLVVTNVGGLTRILKESLEWFLRLEASLKSSNGQIKKRWHLESAFYREALKENLRKYPHNELRSDLDFFYWL